MLQSLICWNLLEKREPYRDTILYEKAIKADIGQSHFGPDIYAAVRFALYTKTLRFSLRYGSR
jgi:hypothetical protein